MTEHVIVIGAGPGGLATAMLLAKAGLRVTLLEKLNRPGGRTSAIEAHGFRFDLGPTFFLFPLSLERIYAACGHDLRAEVPMMRLDPQYHLVFGAGGDIWATPKLFNPNWELLLRHDENKPTKGTDQKRKRDIVGIAYWVPNLQRVTAALMLDYDSLSQSGFTPARPKDTRYGLKMLINF